MAKTIAKKKIKGRSDCTALGLYNPRIILYISRLCYYGLQQSEKRTTRYSKSIPLIALRWRLLYTTIFPNLPFYCQPDTRGANSEND